MPEGVEHEQMQTAMREDIDAFPSLMPEGVEHKSGNPFPTMQCSVSFADAGRR